MALVQQQAIEFPFRTEDGGAVIHAPRLFRAMTEALQDMAGHGIQVLCVSPLAPPESGGRSKFVAALRAQAHRVIDLHEAEDGLWLQEEGVPKPRRWMIPRPLWNRL